MGSIIILPQASIEQVRPISETEASMHWEILSKIRVFLVKIYLSGLMLELSVSSLQQSIKFQADCVFHNDINIYLRMSA
jgi:hypothetical protein